MKMNKTLYNLKKFSNHRLSIIRRNAYTLPSNIPIEVDSKSELNDLKDFKKHNGILKSKTIQINEYLEKTINKILSDHSIAPMVNEAAIFKEFMQNRRNPVEFKDQQNLINQIEEDNYVDENEKVKLSPDERKDLENFQQNEVKKKLKTHLFKWSAINYTQRLALIYMISYFTPQYAVLNQIFHEIERKDPDFLPTHAFDFGSGVGTAMWAANSVWRSDIKEFFNSDHSSHMNELSDLILRGGDKNQKPKLSGVLYRQSLPSSSNLKYELVISAYSLMEQPNCRKRKEILETLWKKVAPNGYLVVVEQSSIYGYELVMEARTHIIEKLCIKENELENDNKHEQKSYGHIFSPCPHDSICPIQADNLKCTFRTRYYPLKIYDNNKPEKHLQIKYSYVVIKKSSRNKETISWPRVVHRDPQKMSGHIHSWFCTRDANFDHYIATKNRSRTMYHLLKYLHVGDILPIIYPDSKIIRAEHKKFKSERMRGSEEILK